MATAKNKEIQQLLLKRSFEKKILEAILKVRENPQEWITRIEARLKKIKGKEYHSEDGIILMTKEGKEAGQDAIKYLKDTYTSRPNY